MRQIADTNFDCVLHGFFDSRQLPIKKPMERRVIDAAGYRLPKENIEKISLVSKTPTSWHLSSKTYFIKGNIVIRNIQPF